MKSREWLERAIALESDVTPLAGGNGVVRPTQKEGRLAYVNAMEPAQTAEIIFQESCMSIMGHAIRGVINHFHNNAIELHVQVIADTVDAIRLRAPNEGATSVLYASMIRRQNLREHDRLHAKIFIHKHASKHLARFCVAHELYHLLLEQSNYIGSGRKHWRAVAPTKEIEDACNEFARNLCNHIDVLHHDQQFREKHVYFPKPLLEKGINTSNTNSAEWPDGVCLDPVHPFTERPTFKK
jgi:hypothetical protein